MKKLTINELLTKGQLLFTEVDKEDQLLDVRLLLEYVLGCNHTYILVNGNETVDDALAEQFMKYIDMRITGIPYQHIVGEQNFMGYDFYVSGDTLIPRSDTEVLVEFANKIINSNNMKNVMDIGTGTGCIPISVCLNKKSLKAIGVDISIKALEIAKKNGKRYNLDDRLKWKLSDLFGAFDESYYEYFDMITSNPPYIPTKDIEELKIEVKEYDPMLALDGGNDGLDFYREISKQANQYLRQGGYLVFEIGHNQYEDVYELLESSDYSDIGYKKDLQGYKRVIYGIKNRGEENV